MDPQEWLEAQQQRTTELLERAQSAKAKLAGTRVSASARDQSATVTVGPNGMLLGVQFTPRAEELSLSLLSARVMEAYRAACAESSARTLEVMAELVGPESKAVDHIRNTMPNPEDPATEEWRG